MHFSAMCHVLIIEDDWLIADHMAHLVESAGATSVDMAESEEDAVACALARPPDVIISDVDLREGTGPAAIERISSALEAVRVMFVTGEPLAFRPALPDTPVLEKPFDDQSLVTTFKTLASGS